MSILVKAILVSCTRTARAVDYSNPAVSVTEVHMSVLGQVGQIHVLNKWANFGTLQVASGDSGPAVPYLCQHAIQHELLGKK